MPRQTHSVGSSYCFPDIFLSHFRLGTKLVKRNARRRQRWRRRSFGIDTTGNAAALASFNEIDIDAYFMEYDSDRAGGFEPLRFVPKGKTVVLGLVTSKSGKLESKDEQKRRIDQASKYISLDQLCLSPQCGFASTEEGNILAEDEQWAKLRMIVELADEVWGR